MFLCTLVAHVRTCACGSPYAYMCLIKTYIRYVCCVVCARVCVCVSVSVSVCVCVWLGMCTLCDMAPCPGLWISGFKEWGFYEDSGLLGTVYKYHTSIKTRRTKREHLRTGIHLTYSAQLCVGSYVMLCTVLLLVVVFATVAVTGYRYRVLRPS